MVISKKIWAIVFGILMASTLGYARSTALLLVQTIPLPHVEGRIDHMDIDLKRERLFVAALGNNTVEVADLIEGKVTQSIRESYEPQGVAYVPELNKLFVANGRNGTCTVFDASSFKMISTIKLGEDADNVRYDSTTQRIYVGYGEGTIAFFDANTNRIKGNIKLSGHPESFQIDEAASKIYVNVPSDNHTIVVIDLRKGKVVSRWGLPGFLENFPMALDTRHHRLFIGTRQPAQLLVLDTQSGEIVATLECSKDVDDIFYDTKRGQIYASFGEGFIGVYKQTDADHYQRIAKVRTVQGARTSLFVPELNRLYVAIPKQDFQEAEFRVYQVKP